MKAPEGGWQHQSQVNAQAADNWRNEAATLQVRVRAAYHLIQDNTADPQNNGTYSLTLSHEQIVELLNILDTDTQ